MFPDNSWYGHRRALASYCGRPDGPILGLLQHGWMPSLPRDFGHGRIPGVPVFVWSESEARRLKGLGRTRVRSIGAPFLYRLPTMESSSRSDASGTLALLSHTAEGLRQTGDLENFLEAVQSSCPPPFTVAVFYQDWNSALLERIHAIGWRAVCFGTRATPDFLERVVSALNGVECVAGEFMQSGLLYGGAMGKRIVLTMTAEDFERLPNGVSRRNTSLSEWAARHGTSFTLSASRDLARRELGWDSMLTPIELSEIIGWSSRAKRTAALCLATAVDLRHGRGPRRGEFKSWVEF